MTAARFVAPLICALLAACTSVPDTQAGALSGGTPPSAVRAEESEASTTLRWALTEPAGITPNTAVDASGLTIVDLLFDSLTAIGPGDTVVPSLASSWVSQDNASRWVFTLADARFHDGRPVTAPDVVRGWEAAVMAGRPQLQAVQGFHALRGGSAQHLLGVDSPDDRTLVVQLTAPDVTFPLTAAHPSLGPLPPPPEGRGGGRATFAERPVGNGPFEMAEPWARGRFVRLRRVDRPGNSAGSRDEVREVVFQMTDPATAYVRFQQGRVDISPIPGGALQEAIELYGESRDGTAAPGVHTDPEPVLVYLGANARRAPMDDVEIRRAVSLAVDRASLGNEIAEGNVTVARSMVPVAVTEESTVTCTTCRRNLAEARRIFTDRGVSSLELIHEESPGDDILVERLRGDLAEAGVTLETRGLGFPQLLAALEAGDTDLYVFGWWTEIPSPLAAIAPLVTGTPELGTNVNYGRYQDDDVDRLVDAARSRQVESRRQDLLTAAEEIALGRDQAIIPLYTTHTRLAVAERVRGFAPSTYRALTLRGVTVGGV